MTFAIHWSKKAGRVLGRLPHQIARRISCKVDSIKDHPFHFLEHHYGSDLFKLRVGSYRLLVAVDLEKRIISVQAFGHRRNIYKRIL